MTEQDQQTDETDLDTLASEKAPIRSFRLFRRKGKPSWKQRAVFYSVSLSAIAVLALLAMPNFIGAGGGCGGSPLNGTRANAHTLQTMIETYGVDTGGVYPANLQELEIEAKREDQGWSPYWKELTNPYTQYTGYGKAFTDAGQPPVEGIVLYQPVLQTAQHGKTEVLGYAVYAYKSDTERIQDQGRDFFLSNS